MCPPPANIGRVAKGAAHDRSTALCRIGQLVGQDRNLDPRLLREVLARDTGRCSDQMRVPLVSWVNKDGNAGGQEFGSRRRDRQDTSISQTECQRRKLRREGDIINFGLRDGRLTLWTPQRRRQLRVGTTRLIQLDK